MQQIDIRSLRKFFLHFFFLSRKQSSVNSSKYTCQFCKLLYNIRKNNNNHHGDILINTCNNKQTCRLVNKYV